MDLDMQMSDPTFWNDPEKAKKISQEATLLKTEVEGHEELVRKADDLSDYLEMAMEDGDASFAEDIEKQYHDLLKDIEKREVRLLLSGEYDKCNALITFHAGAGGTEAQDWAQMLIRMYTRWAERNGYKLTILDMQPGDEAGIKSAAFRVEGEYAYGYLKSEKGVHRLVRISPFDAAARRHTSFTAVDVMPELPDDVEVEINMDDVRVDYFRASGAGGQHVNKTSSAVRMTHIPTGMVVECQDERSQLENRAKALRVLKARLLDQAQQKADAELTEERRSQVGTGDRSERIRTYNFPQGRVTDHRINLTLYKLDNILNGDIDEFIQALAEARRAELMKEAEDE